ncbi:MAG TPA: hypothetical protein VFI03_04795 [Solirubrobacterales bacterium]|nr:hypothetical protein [Solirubrobacterales bacterium]
MRRSGLVLLAALAAIALSAPAHALALDSDLKGFAVFRLAASNGYSIFGLAASERADGRGDIALFVYNEDEAGVIYGAPATVTPTRLEADLGRLGRISLDITPLGHKRTLRSRCGEPVSFEPNSYRGTFEFHGEEGYTEASATTLHEYARFYVDLGCSTIGSGEGSGAGLPGARLRLSSQGRRVRLSLQANKNHPRARSRFEVEIHEKHQGIAISRSTTVWTGADAFDYDPLLRTATLDPPAPFSGRATYRRGAAAANRWTGNLTVDLPGRSDVPLTSSGIRPTLVPACRYEGEGRHRC